MLTSGTWDTWHDIFGASGKSHGKIHMAMTFKSSLGKLHVTAEKGARDGRPAIYRVSRRQHVHLVQATEADVPAVQQVRS